MKKRTNDKNIKSQGRKIPTGIPEFAAALGVVVLIIGLSIAFNHMGATDKSNDTADEATAPEVSFFDHTIMNSVPDRVSEYPLSVSEYVNIDKIYAATGYFPEDGNDEAVENVLAVQLTNTSDKALEYLTFRLFLNESSYRFAATTVPAGKSVYVFNDEKKEAPEVIRYVDIAVDYEVYFPEEPSIESEVFDYGLGSGSVTVTNISDTDIESDIVVYYKNKSDRGYYGGITYRFRITGGLRASESFTAYAPHVNPQMTEIMFVQYEK